MGKYLKLFETHTEYEEYLGGGEMILPNVSHCIDQNDVHYNKLPAFILVNFTVPENEEDTLVWLYNNDGVKFIEIDNKIVTPTETDASNNLTLKGAYINSGNHTVKYYLEDETILGEILSAYKFWHVDGSAEGVDIYYIAKNVILPDTIKEIPSWTLCRLRDCSVNVPQNLKHVGNYAFNEVYHYHFTTDELAFIFSISDGKPFIEGK